jgi:hypothetical protein
MANEISLTASLSCFKSAIMGTAIGRSITNLLRNMSGSNYIQDTVVVPTSATVVALGGVTNPHWSFWLNLDPINYIQLQNGVSGAVLVRLLAGDFAMFPLDQGATPYAISNTGACQMEYLILAA